VRACVRMRMHEGMWVCGRVLLWACGRVGGRVFLYNKRGPAEPGQGGGGGEDRGDGDGGDPAESTQVCVPQGSNTLIDNFLKY
jgi:hypothetical protein